MASVLKFDDWQTTAGSRVNSVVQVGYAFYNTPGTVGAGDWTDIPGLSVTITPKYSTSKFFIVCRSFGEPNTDEHSIHFCIKRNGSQINLGQASGNRLIIMHSGMSAYHGGDTDSTAASQTVFTYDAPSTTSPVTYTMQIKNQGNSGFTYAYNRTWGDGDAGSNERGSSEIIVMEIAG